MNLINVWLMVVVTVFILPIIILIHELGHAVAVKLCGGEIEVITIGYGKTILKIGKLQNKAMFFYSGSCRFIGIGNNLIKQTFITLGGVLFNIISVLVVLYLNAVRYTEIYEFFISISIFAILLNLIPTNILFCNISTDGKQLCQLYKNRKITK